MDKLGILKVDVAPDSTTAGIHSVGVDEYVVPPGETIRVTVGAVKTPYAASFGELPPSTHWRIVQNPSPEQPKEIREFTMPNEELHFEIVYRFPRQPPEGAHYARTVEGRGEKDGPFAVKPLPFFQTVTRSYLFHVAS